MKKDQFADLESDIEAWGVADPFRTGVVPRSVVADLQRKPSWDEVHEYLCEGKHRANIERYARESPDFADVLEAMRSDLEEAPESTRDDVQSTGATIIPFSTGRRDAPDRAAHRAGHPSSSPPAPHHATLDAGLQLGK